MNHLQKYLSAYFSWRLQVAEYDLDLEVQAALDGQLMDHSVHYWEGAVDVSGSHRGRGYLELSGYSGNVAGRLRQQQR